eukprot:g29718.t1
MLQGRAIPIADCITVNSALSGCAAAADWQRTLQLLEELTTGRWGIEPNTITFNTALNACARLTKQVALQTMHNAASV